MIKDLLKFNSILYIIMYMLFSIIGANLDCYSWSEGVRIMFVTIFLLFAVMISMAYFDIKSTQEKQK